MKPAIILPKDAAFGMVLPTALIMQLIAKTTARYVRVIIAGIPHNASWSFFPLLIMASQRVYKIFFLSDFIN
jgi:hypothetical protein